MSATIAIRINRSMRDASVQALVKRVTLASRIDLLILTAIVVDMVIKPGL